MTYAPDRRKAFDIANALMEAAKKPPDDPEALSLGVCMFVGGFLLAMTEENRLTFLEGCMGMSYTIEDIVAEIRHARKN